MATEPMVVGKSRHSEQLRKQIGKLAASRKNVLIVGEPGVGKRTVAACIAAGEPVSVFDLRNCTESDFEVYLSSVSDPNVLFLNVEESGFRVQDIAIKFVEEDRKHTRVMFVLSTTTRDLLLDRKISENFCALVNGFEKVEIKPLRERPEDIPVLVKHFARGLTIDINSLDTLVNLPWKKNISELRSVIDYSIASGGEGRFVLPAELIDERTEVAKMVSGLMETQKSVLNQSLDVIENTIIRRTLERFGFNESKAAQFLGMSRQTFDQKLRRLTLASADSQ